VPLALAVTVAAAAEAAAAASGVTQLLGRPPWSRWPPAALT